MKKLTLLAILAVAFTAMPAFASVQNVKVSGDIDSTFLHRANFDLGAAVIKTREQNVFLTQTRVRIDADLSDNVSSTVALINERAWNEDNLGTSADSTDIDLNLAYVTLREMLYSPLTVVLGRQAFHYGNSFIVDSAGTNNVAPADSGLSLIAKDLTKQTALDAIRLIFDYNPLKLELLYAKLDANTVASSGSEEELNRDDIDLLGFNSTYELGDKMNTQVEGYIFARINHGAKSSGAGSINNAVQKNDTLYVPGLRASTNPIEGLNVQGEFAWQRGTKVTPSGTLANDVQQREAYGAQVIANYQIPVLKENKPMAQYVYTWVSGDKNSGDAASAGQRSANRWTAWDPFLENQAGGKIYNVMFNLSNAHIHTASLQIDPIQDVTVKGSWTGLWTDRDVDCGGNSTTNIPLVACASTVVAPDAATYATVVQDGADALGHEFDIDTTYNYTEDVQIGASLGWFIPGEVFAPQNRDIATQAIVHANVNF